jgi:hypothetical protein
MDRIEYASIDVNEAVADIWADEYADPFTRDAW